MPAIIAFKDMKITRHQVGAHMGQTQIDGSLTFEVRSERVAFDYVYEFRNMDTPHAAIQLATNHLQRELSALAAATQAIQFAP